MEMRSKRLISLTLLLAASLTPAGASAKVQINIDLAAQQLTATRKGGETVVWKVSSGRPGYETPAGHYTVYRMEPDHKSDEYDQAPMPYSMFFSPRGLAIHGTYERGLGRPASHGCVRLSVANAKKLYEWIVEDGGETGGAEVEIVGVTPGGRRGKDLEARDRDGKGRDDRDRSSGRAAEDAAPRARDRAADRPQINRNVNGSAGAARSADPFEDMVDSVWRF
jgi:hypothetical protein